MFKNTSETIFLRSLKLNLIGLSANAVRGSDDASRLLSSLEIHPMLESFIRAVSSTRDINLVVRTRPSNCLSVCLCVFMIAAKRICWTLDWDAIILSGRRVDFGGCTLAIIRRLFFYSFRFVAILLQSIYDSTFVINRWLYLFTVPPHFLASENTESEMEVMEGANVTMTCEARGLPAPNVTWRRDDGGRMSLATPGKNTNLPRQ